MPLHVAVVMDPIGSIKIAKDTTFAMLLEAQRRGHALHYVVPGGLGSADGRALARLAPLQVRDDPERWYELGPARTVPLAEMDVVLMRTRPAGGPRLPARQPDPVPGPGPGRAGGRTIRAACAT